ncbi:lachesin-like isoform X2 [Pollicipes pollicipes]|uniref:lachesin-like isoform X2 n=1 Tax=Pollicipes pollicipes TaxID=41117 RepID=UPI0018849DE7|nr:lachesin-like isoform X2 [Pollicipes pollicipes]
MNHPNISAWMLAGLVSAALFLAAWGARPEFIESLKNLTVPIGRDATFTCVVRHLGGYRVGWVKADSKAIQAIHTHVITHNPRVRVSHRDLTTWNLHINNVQEEDRGTYMCQINYDPMMSQYGILNVVVPPDILSDQSSGDLTIPEGGSGQLQCRARGYPTPTIIWRREDGRRLTVTLPDASGALKEKRVTEYEGETLPLMKVRRSDTGYYVCIASNGLPPSVSKHIKVEVHFHPVVQVRHQLHGVKLGSDVTLSCHVEALPKSINYWNKGTGEMLIQSRKFNISEEKESEYSLTMKLTIRSFEVSDAGEYICTAKNSIGEVQSEIQVYEIRLTSEPDPHRAEQGTDDIAYSGSEEEARPPAPAAGTHEPGHTAVSLTPLEHEPSRHAPAPPPAVKGSGVALRAAASLLATAAAVRLGL